MPYRSEPKMLILEESLWMTTDQSRDATLWDVDVIFVEHGGLYLVSEFDNVNPSERGVALSRPYLAAPRKIW